jgi:hypothetical protein
LVPEPRTNDAAPHHKYEQNIYMVMMELVLYLRMRSEDVFQQVPWFATTESGTVDLNTSFNHGGSTSARFDAGEKNGSLPNAMANSKKAQGQQLPQLGNGYQQRRRSVTSALSSFRDWNKLNILYSKSNY